MRDYVPAVILSVLAVVPGAVLTANALIGRIAPPRPTKQTRQELAKRYVGWQLLEALVCALVFLLGMATVWWLLSTFNQWARSPASAGQFYAGSILWGFPGMALGLLASGLIAPVIFRRWLGQRYAELISYEDIVNGYNQLKVNPWVLRILSVAAVLMIFQIWNLHTFFYADRIEIRELTDLTTHTYSYSDVDDIMTSLYKATPNGNRIYGRNYVIRFRDRRMWGALSDDYYGLSAQQKSEIAEYVSNKSGKPIRELAVLP